MNSPQKLRGVRFLRALSSCCALALSLAALFTLTHAWRNRTERETVSAAFRLENSGTILRTDFSVDTYYLGLDRDWHLVTSDYEREEGVWLSKWDGNSAPLIPGERTEYKTVITNLLPKDQKVSLFLKDVWVQEGLEDNVVIGAYDPEVCLFSCDDTAYFDNTNSAAYLPLCPEAELEGLGTLTVRWYVGTGNGVIGGGYPALVDKSTKKAITDGSGNHYYINEYDENGNPCEAFLCDQSGVLLFVEGAYVEYKGDYHQTESSEMTYGNMGQLVGLSGLVVAAG